MTIPPADLARYDDNIREHLRAMNTRRSESITLRCFRMLHAEAYSHDEKAQLHESLPGLAKAIAQRTGLRNVTLDSFIVSATRFENLRVRYDDGSWDRKRFAERHVLFPERGEDYDYLAHLMTPPAVKHPVRRSTT